jgi:succinoglycan biosynthesis transport protein ExoP
MSSTKPPVSKSEFSPLSLSRILWKHRLIVLAITVLGSAASFAIVHQLPAIYRSEALILVDSQKIPERYVSSTVNTEVQDRLSSISQEILSTTPLQKIIDNFGLYREERKRLVQEEIIDLMRKDISIKLEKGWTRDRTGAFRVGYQGRNPTLVTEVASQLANLFIEGNLRTRERQAEGTADFIDSQLKEAKKTLDELEARVSKYKLAHNGDLPEQETALSATLARLQVELQGNQDAINRAQQNKVMLQGSMDMAEAAAGDTRNRQRPAQPLEVRAYSNPPPQKESEFLQAQYDALSKRYEPTYPRMVALQHEIDKQKMAEDEQRARIENLKTEITLADREIQQRNSERERILKSLAQYQARMEQLPVREQEMAELTRDYENSKANYKSLLDKKLAAGMATDMERRQQGERFTMLDPPRVPEKPVSPKTPLLEGFGCALSLALALAFPIAKETKKNAVLGEWELPEGLDVLGRVPFIKPDSRGLTQNGDSRPTQKRKWALVSSLVLSILGTCAVGIYLYWGRR